MLEEKIVNVVDIQYGKNSIEGDKTIINDTESALCELIDNAIDAGSTSIEVTFNENSLNKLTKIIIKDNGRGMDEEDLVNFFGIGTETNVVETSIGHYGFGANFSLKFLSKSVRLTTKKKFQTNKIIATWLLDSDNFQKYQFENRKTNDDDDYDQSYTEIICYLHDNVDNIDLHLDFEKDKNKKESRFGKLKSRLSARYKYLIDNNNEYKNVNISFNKTELTPIDPLYENSDLTKEWPENGSFLVNLIDKNGLPFTSKINYKGFYVSDNGKKNARNQFDRQTGTGLPIAHQGCYLNLQCRGTGRYLTLGEGIWGGESTNPAYNSGRIEFKFDKSCRDLFGLGANKSKPSFKLNRADENSKLILDKIIDFRSWISKTYKDNLAENKKDKNNKKSKQDKIILSLEEIDFDILTPIEALNILNEMRNELLS